jgi:DNA-binding transcriptional LysR family regulator
MFSTLDLREIRVFLTLAEELHYGRAAERLTLTPSRVSQIVRVLETRVGGRLFDRTSRHVRLTPVGEQLLHSVAPLYHDLERAFENCRAAAIGVTGTVRIGIYSPSLVGPYMVQIVRTFTTRHPGAEVAFIDMGVERNYLDVLRDREVDMLAIRLPVTESDITVGPVLSHEERVLVISRDDPLAQRKSVSLEDLGDRPVSDVKVFPREMMDAFIPPVTPSGRRLRRIDNRNFEEMVMRVALGQEAHPTVRSLVEAFSHPGIVSVPMTGLPPSQTALAWLTADRSPKLHAFVRAAADSLAHTDLARYQPPATTDKHDNRAATVRLPHDPTPARATDGPDAGSGEPPDPPPAEPRPTWNAPAPRASVQPAGQIEEIGRPAPSRLATDKRRN